ncbi:MAG: CRISPR-associated protein Cas6 [Oceanospirillaceae bacterium]|nr:CRISPR-associated protein Cas6 [Oceanospirillaceae bacterium]
MIEIANAPPLARYRFRVRATQPLKLPDFAGSMLRGAFGRSLRKLACMTRRPECKGCPLITTCPFPMIFETPPIEDHKLQRFSQMPNPYVIEPPGGGWRRCEPGDEFEFAMVLIGEAINQLPLIILAWERALENGLSKNNSRCQLKEVWLESPEQRIYQSGPDAQIQDHNAAIPPPDSTAESVTLALKTPLRLQKQGKLVGRQELDARTFCTALARRLQLLNDIHNPGVSLDFERLISAAESLRLESDLKWWDWTRYSNRQAQSMTLGGLTGKLTLTGDLKPLIGLLHLGQWLHLGKNATFGLGQYQLFNNKEPC